VRDLLENAEESFLHSNHLQIVLPNTEDHKRQKLILVN
jgi:hypothetical protein